jgi:hypothetical protein
MRKPKATRDRLAKYNFLFFGAYRRKAKREKFKKVNKLVVLCFILEKVKLILKNG